MRRMMVDIPVPPKWKVLWNIWDLRILIIFSLSLQTFLIFAAPLRKRTRRTWLVVSLWSAYLLADWAANIAIGLISNSQANPSSELGKKVRTAVENEDLLAFWAPFLLVHLGGPDTITAFALEDNELWLRHLLGCVFQCLATLYVYVQSLPQNGLWIPTMLMFMTGIVKYVERTRSLYLASADRFRFSMVTDPDLGPNYAKLKNELRSMEEAKLPTRIEYVPELDRATTRANKFKEGNLTELEVIQYGYQFFEKFQGLVVDMMFSQKERNQSRNFFLNRNAKDAFKVVEVELNFIYEVLFTKRPLVFDKTKSVKITGIFYRVFSLVAVCSAIVLFIFKNKSQFATNDVCITYVLLFGALVLDMTALTMLLFSDWSIITFCESFDVEVNIPWKTHLASCILRLRPKGTLKDVVPRSEKQSHKGPMRLFKRRWAESISTYNLLYHHLNPPYPPLKWCCEHLKLSDFLDRFKYVEHEKFTTKLRDFIFKEIKSKSELADDMQTAKEITSTLGEWILAAELGGSSILKSVFKFDYDQSLILWHLTTEICYGKELYDECMSMACNINGKNGNTDQREISKLLSDYMLYLLIMQPSLMSAVAGINQIRLTEICAQSFAEASRIFSVGNAKDLSPPEKNANKFWVNKTDLKQAKACVEILKISQMGGRKSFLFESCCFAKELMAIEEKTGLNKWSIISKVWVELLCYAASNSRGNNLAAQVSSGGELITIVWLLMTHFGLGKQFQIKEFKTVKLIVGK